MKNSTCPPNTTCGTPGAQSPGARKQSHLNGPAGSGHLESHKPGMGACNGMGKGKGKPY